LDYSGAGHLQYLLYVGWNFFRRYSNPDDADIHDYLHVSGIFTHLLAEQEYHRESRSLAGHDHAGDHARNFPNGVFQTANLSSTGGIVFYSVLQRIKPYLRLKAGLKQVKTK
jgi:hypothetical protein